MAASSVIGALRVNLGLDSAKFDTGLDKSSGRLKRWAAMAGQVAAGLAASAGAALGALGLSALNAGAEIERLSQVSNTLPGQFQGWAAGARTVGIEQEKLADILKDVNDRVGDFVQTGGGPMADFFEKIAPKVGVTAASFRKLSGADALQLYVSSLEKANVNQQDFTFYMEAMASDSTLLLPLLRNGGAAMKAYGERAKSMGAIMDDAMLAKLKEGKVAVAEITLAFTGIRNTLGAQVVPALQTLSTVISAAAGFFHQHAGTIAAVLQQVAVTAGVVAVAMASRYAVALGVTTVKATVAAIRQTIALEMALGATSRAAAVTSVSIKLLTGALALLKRAMVAIGIGALVVGIGWVINGFLDLVKASGGFGNALKIVGDLGLEVWDRLGLGAEALAWSISAAAAGIKASFLEAFEWILRKFAGVTTAIADGINGMFAKAGIDLGLTGMGEDAAEALRVAASEARDDATNRAGAASSVWSEATAPLESWGALTEVLEETEDQALETGGAATDLGDATADAGEKGKNKIKEVLDQLRKQHAELVATKDMTVAQVAAWQAMRDAGVSATSAIGQEITRLTSGIASLGVLNDLSGQLRASRATAGMSDLESSIWEKQQEAGVDAGSANGRLIDQQMRQIENMKTLKDATNEWRDSVGSALSEFITKGGSFKDVLKSILTSFVDMVANNAWKSLFNGAAGAGGGGGGGFAAGLLQSFGIGRNANGTQNWRGGLTSLHERGGEIYNLPKGTQVIPHDISKRMADGAADRAANVGITVGIDPDTGNLTAFVDGRATSIATSMGQQVLRQVPAYMKDREKRTR